MGGLRQQQCLHACKLLAGLCIQPIQQQAQAHQQQHTWESCASSTLATAANQPTSQQDIHKAPKPPKHVGNSSSSLRGRAAH
jgi:hypothetical protein